MGKFKKECDRTNELLLEKLNAVVELRSEVMVDEDAQMIRKKLPDSRNPLHRLSQHHRQKESEIPKLRVAAYCRVSTDSDEQATSYEAQVEHYTDYNVFPSIWTPFNI